MMIEISTILSLIQATGIVVGVVYYVLNIQNNRRNQEIAVKNQEFALKSQEQTLETRQAQLFMQVLHRFYEPDFFEKYTQVLYWKWADYDDFIQKYGWKNNPQAWYSEGSIAAYFEGIGLLMNLGLLDVKLVHGLLFRHVKLFWEKIMPVSLEMRKRLKIPHVDQWVEYLYSELMKYDEALLKS
jgi:hypothetical protein